MIYSLLLEYASGGWLWIDGIEFFKRYKRDKV